MLLGAVSAVVDRWQARWVVAQERPSISRDDGRSCCTDVCSGAWVVAVDRVNAREIGAILVLSCAARLGGN